MKQKFRRCCCFAVFAAIGLLSVTAGTAPTETRASHLGGTAAGLAKIMHMVDFLEEYPGSRTALFSYVKLDGRDVTFLLRELRQHAAIQAGMRRSFWPQLPLETSHLSLAQFRRELAHPGSLVEWNVRTLAREIGRYRLQGKWFFIRPFSEMNDATPGAPWEFGNKNRHNTPQEFAAAWRLLRDVFNQEGASNAIFVFSPLAAYRVHHEDQILETLNRIPSGYIDAFGLNVYSRPRSAYNGSSNDPIPFAELVQPWMKVLAKSRHEGIPLAIPEMGVSNQATEERRAVWLHQAFQFARAHGFVTVTYFNYPHPYWKIDEQSATGEVLKAEINSY